MPANEKLSLAGEKLSLAAEELSLAVENLSLMAEPLSRVELRIVAADLRAVAPKLRAVAAELWEADGNLRAVPAAWQAVAEELRAVPADLRAMAAPSGPPRHPAPRIPAAGTRESNEGTAHALSREMGAEGMANRSDMRRGKQKTDRARKWLDSSIYWGIHPIRENAGSGPADGRFSL